MRISVKRASIFFFVFTFIIILSSMSDGLSTTEKYNQAKTLFEQKNYTQAKDLLLSIIDSQDNPNQGDTFILTLKCYLYLSNNDELGALYTKYYSEFQGTQFEPLARLVRVDSLRKLKKDLDSVYKEYENIYNNFSNYPDICSEALYKMGSMELYDLNKASDAIIKLQKFLEQYPNSLYAPDAHFDIIKATSITGDAETMVSYYDKLKEKYPDNKIIGSSGAFTIGMYYQKHDDWGKALKYYDIVLNEYTDFNGTVAYPLSLVRKADILQGRRKQDEAIALYHTCMEKYPEKKALVSWSQMEIATSYLLKGDLDKAREEIEKAMDIVNAKEDILKANSVLNGIYILKGEEANNKMMEGLEAYEYALAVKAHYARYSDIAIKLFINFLLKYPDSNKINKVKYFLAFSLYYSGENDDYLNTSSELIADNPELIDIEKLIFYQVVILIQKGKGEEARKLIDSTQSRFPNSTRKEDFEQMRLESYLYGENFDKLTTDTNTLIIIDKLYNECLAQSRIVSFIWYKKNLNLGAKYFNKTGRNEEIINLFESQMELNLQCNSPQLYFISVTAYVEYLDSINKIQEAIALAMKAIEDNKNPSKERNELIEYIARIYYIEGNRERSKQILEYRN